MQNICKIAKEQMYWIVKQYQKLSVCWTNYPIEKRKKLKDTSLLLFGIILFFILSKQIPLFLSFLFNTASQDFLSIIPAITQIISYLFIAGLILLFYFIYFKSVRDFVEKFPSLINTILIFVTVLLTLSIYLIDQVNSYYKVNTLLVAVDYVNLDYANKFIRDTNSQWIYWTYFLTTPYEQNIPFIGKNFPHNNCSYKYLNIISEMEIFNEINRNTNDNIGWSGGYSLNQAEINRVIFNSRKQDTTKKAKQIQTDLKSILENCH